MSARRHIAALCLVLAGTGASPGLRGATTDPSLHLTVESAVAACLAEPDGAERCLAQTAVYWGDSAACDRSRDPGRCLDSAGSLALEACDELPEDRRLACFLLTGTELGAIEACERLRGPDRATCVAGVAAMHEDLEVIERTLQDGEERDLALGIFATATHDMRAVERIRDPRSRDGTRIMLVLPLAMVDDVQVPDDWCDRLATEYGGEYGDSDAEINRDLCRESVQLARLWGRLDSDRQRQQFIEALAAESERLDEEIAAADAAADDERWALYDSMGLGRPAHARRDETDDALTFYTGQRNTLELSAWNGTVVPLRRIGITIEGEAQWLQVEELEPVSLDIPSGGTQKIRLVFTVAADAPEGARQQITVTARGDEDAGLLDPGEVVLDRFDIVLRRRTLTVEIEAGEPVRVAPQ